MRPSIFLDFHLPNSATWFYFSFFLAIALFFQFSRLLSLRNWDLLALFLFAPGFLLIQEANAIAATAPPRKVTSDPDPPPSPHDRADRERFLGYALLLASSGWWFVRCLLDLATSKRPLPSPNLSTAGLAWFGCALLFCLGAVTYMRTEDPWGSVGRRPAAISGVEQGATVVVQTAQAGEPESVRIWVERTFAIGCHISVVISLVLLGVRVFQDLSTGVAAAALYLLVPYTAFFVGQVHHVWPAALMLWALYAYRSPIAAGILLGLAAGTTFFPLVLIPAWMQFYRGKGLTRFAIALASTGGISLAITILLVLFTGFSSEGYWSLAHLEEWQPWRVPTTDSIWTGAHWAYRLPIFIVYAAFVLGSIAWPPVRNLGDLIAVSAALLIGIQFWHADRGGLYVLWYSPLLVLISLRPNLSDVQPGVPPPLPRVLSRLGRRVRNRIRPLDSDAIPPSPAPTPANVPAN